MTDEIRRALENRIAASAGSDERQARIRARINELDKKEEPVMKRKWSLAMALALAVVLIVGTGLATGIKLNLFGMISQSDPSNQYNWEQDRIKLSRLGEKNTLISVSADAPEGIQLEKMIQVQDAYYDGYVLLVSYIRGESELFHTELEWAPDGEEELTDMGAPIPRDLLDNYFTDEARQASLQQAIEAGETWGRKWVTVSGGYDFLTTDGNKLWTGSTHYATLVDEEQYIVMQFASPLPEEIRDKDEIVIQMPFTFGTIYFWFDGADLYTGFGEDEQGVLTVTVGRDTDVPQAQYASEKVSLHGTELTVEAEAVTPYLLHVVMSAEKPYFTPGKGGPTTWIAHNEVGQQCSMSMKVYGEADIELGAMMQRIIFGDMPSKQYTLYLYPDCSEDGTSKELWLDLLGEIPETITVVALQNDVKEASVTLHLAE